MTMFSLDQPPMLSRATFDRADEIRDDPDRMLSGWATARVLLVDGNGRYPVADGGLHWLDATHLGAEPPADAVFLGLDSAGGDLWTRRVDHIDGPTDDPRRGAHGLDADEAGLLATALGILNWHATARFSPVDGSVTAPARGGWVRRHVESGVDEFPRTDPAIITVVHDGADRVLLGRQTVWPDGWYSTLAGFVEPGESLEQCVLREVHEEVGITVREPRYLGSQPWPFPRSLMLGFAAIGDPDEPLAFLDGEIGDAAWFDRAEVIEALAEGGDWVRADGAVGTGTDERHLRLPGSISIARSLITSWAYSDR
ncbi:NAD(+) diphosphatase [Gordonia sp. ABSL11-1]|uniref:NAD(+) diphosphatase n=1 Tax=Gordonia sp. ABSL11-1 TaxID=3053924 RepID=UPI002572EF4C|nr:NAD(+) diphosphatase [Gordonia sp. ABSL11-1]MDL9947862.1 NAD(+) diphosphatase [Gordonia sp. ABSL11-1]